MKPTIVSFFLLSSIWTFSQKEHALRLHVGYYGETLTHPGLNLGIEFAPKTSDRYEMLFSVNTGGYVRTKNNTSLFLRGQWGQRLCFAGGLFVDNYLGIGYLHQFTHGGKIYDVKPNGAVVKIANSGSPMIMPSIALGLGYDFSSRSDSGLKVYVRPELFWKAPFNGYYLTNIAINTGLIFQLN